MAGTRRRRNIIPTSEGPQLKIVRRCTGKVVLNPAMRMENSIVVEMLERMRQSPSIS
jgi:hypothetical protein